MTKAKERRFAELSTFDFFNPVGSPPVKDRFAA